MVGRVGVKHVGNQLHGERHEAGLRRGVAHDGLSADFDVLGDPGVRQHRTRVVVPADEPHLEAAGHDDLTDRRFGAHGRVEGVWIFTVG